MRVSVHVRVCDVTHTLQDITLHFFTIIVFLFLTSENLLKFLYVESNKEGGNKQHKILSLMIDDHKAP